MLGKRENSYIIPLYNLIAFISLKMMLNNVRVERERERQRIVCFLDGEGETRERGDERREYKSN